MAHETKTGYSEEWVKSVTFEEFSKAMDHIKALTWLQGDYERITGKKVSAQKVESKKEG